MPTIPLSGNPRLAVAGAVRGRRLRGPSVRQHAPFGLRELFRPAIVDRRGDTLAATQFGNALLWNFLFDRQIDLAATLPSDKFRLCIPREVELEIPTAPKKAELKAFIEATIAKCNIQIDRLFGFYDDSLPRDEQRVGGFDEGRWASPEELAFIARYTAALKTAKKRPTTPLYPKEADILLAARASHSVVLSLDDKPGPIRDASQQGDMVVYLTDSTRADFTRRLHPEKPFARSDPHGAAAGEQVGCDGMSL